MRIAIREWFRSRFGVQEKRRRNRKRLKQTAACLTIGLATAWGGSADAALVKVVMTPEETLTNAYGVIYHRNSSSGRLVSLGTTIGGTTSVLFFDFAQETPQDFAGLSYTVLGLYEGDDGPSVAVSFPNNGPILSGSVWEDLFGGIARKSSMIDELMRGRSIVPFVNTTTRMTGTQYGSEATIINFSQASFGGVVTISIVPEPGSFVLLTSGVGLVALPRRRRT